MSGSDIMTLDLERGQESINLAVYRIRQFFIWDSEEFSVPHRIKFNAIIYITHGAGEHFVDYTLHRLEPGTLLFLSKYQVHFFEANDELDGYIVTFDDDLLCQGDEDPLASEIRSACLAVSSMPAAETGVAPLFQELYREYSLREEEFNAEVLRCLMRAILLKSLVRHYRKLKISGAPTRDDESFRRLVDAIEDNFRKTRNVTDYAERLCRSVKQINKLAKNHSGSTVKQLIDARTVLELKRLLAYSTLPITTIATETGFMESTNMTKFFRHHTDMTPSEFRSMCRKGVAAAKTF